MIGCQPEAYAAIYERAYKKGYEQARQDAVRLLTENGQQALVGLIAALLVEPDPTAGAGSAA
jgi:hypothetical protein